MCPLQRHMLVFEVERDRTGITQLAAFFLSVYWGRKKENLLMAYFSSEDLNADPNGSHPELMVGQKSILLSILKLLSSC